MATAHVFAGYLPNFVLFIADDVSWNDFACYGNPSVRTPHIDRLAKGGMRFTNFYLTASSCSPSRCSIITGRYPHNNGEACELHRPLPAHLVKFPALLRDAGYYTALTGKDHMPQKAAHEEEVWDEKRGGRVPGNSGGEAHWLDVVRNRPRNQPFFFWFASFDANWHDYEAHGRAVRDRQGYLYIRNARPRQAWSGPADSIGSPSHQALRQARDAEIMTLAQADVLLAPRPP